MKKIVSILALTLLIPALAMAAEWSVDLGGDSGQGFGSVVTTFGGQITFNVLTNGIGVPTRAVVLRGANELADLGAEFNFGAATGMVETGADLSGLVNATNLTLRIEGPNGNIEGPLVLIPGADITTDRVQQNFGDIAVGAQSPFRRLRMENDGTENLRISAVIIRGAGRNSYVIETDNCSESRLAPGQACIVRFSFNPTSAGAANGLAVIQSSDPNERELRIQLRGNGI